MSFKMYIIFSIMNLFSSFPKHSTFPGVSGTVKSLAVSDTKREGSMKMNHSHDNDHTHTP